MYQVDKTNRMMSLAVSTAMASALLAGCSMTPAPRADVSAAAAQEALAEGKHDRAIRHAEAAVQADPRNAAYRAMLGNAYLDNGRFASAETSFNDAMLLGDNSPRTALSLALSLSAQAKFSEAAALLNDWETELAPADLGLALSLAGQPERGIHIMGNAIRGGQNTVKMRQNLAYAYALAGRWRDARLMAAQDVPADQLGARMEEWAQLNSPIAYQLRIARLLDVPSGERDDGQPIHLALSNFPSDIQLASEASAYAAANSALAAVEVDTQDVATPAPAMQSAAESMNVQASASELPAVGSPNLALNDYQAPATARPTEFAQAFATDAPAGGSIAQVTQDAIRFVNDPVVQTLPVRYGAAPEPRVSSQARPIASRAVPGASQPATVAPASPDGTHLVQLGSFASEQGARRAWGIYVSRYPELAGHEMVISEAVVRGKRYWRVSAAGFNRDDSNRMCAASSANAGEGCIAWAEGSPLPGAVETGIRFASR